MDFKKIALAAVVLFSVQKAEAQSWIYPSLARQKSQIDTLFPFDVNMRLPDSTQILSSKALQKGRPTVLAFWLTTCYPCQIELNEYAKNLEKWRKEADFDLVAVSTDFPKNYQAIKKRAAELPFPILWDEAREFREFLPGGLNGLPQVFIFDKNGQLAYRKKGFAIDDEQWLFAKIKDLQ